MILGADVHHGWIESAIWTYCFANEKSLTSPGILAKVVEPQYVEIILSDFPRHFCGDLKHSSEFSCWESRWGHVRQCPVSGDAAVVRTVWPTARCG